MNLTPVWLYHKRYILYSLFKISQNSCYPFYQNTWTVDTYASPVYVVAQLPPVLHTEYLLLVISLPR